MRILSFSDIHNNLMAVRKLREQETNRFDAIVVAGDIGDESFDEFLAIMRSFSCPVYYVYGNWDNALPYVSERPPWGRLLHHNVESQNGYFFTGFSGCPSHWGHNPIAHEIYEQLRVEHASVISHWEEAHNQERTLIEQAHKEYEDALQHLGERTQDKRRKRYRRRCEKLKFDRDRKQRLAGRICQRIERTPEYQKYQHAGEKASKDIVKRNKQELVNAIRRSGAPPNRLIIATHDRAYRLHEELKGLRCQLFGHRHGFKHTTYLGTEYVNVSALDKVRSVLPIECEGMVGDMQYMEWTFDNCQNVNVGDYAVIECAPAGTTVTQCSLRMDLSRWVVAQHMDGEPLNLCGAPWVPEEAQLA